MYWTFQRSEVSIAIIKWTDYFSNFLHHTVGEKEILLSYVICELDTVPGAAPPITIGK